MLLFLLFLFFPSFSPHLFLSFLFYSPPILAYPTRLPSCRSTHATLRAWLGLAEKSKRQKATWRWRTMGLGTGRERAAGEKATRCSRERQVRMLAKGASAAPSPMLWRRATNIDECSVTVTRSCVAYAQFPETRKEEDTDSCIQVNEGDTERQQYANIGSGIVPRWDITAASFYSFFARRSKASLA